MGKPTTKHPHSGKFLSVCNFLSKGWEVSILGFLAFIQHEHHLPLSLVAALSTIFIVTQISVSFFAAKIAHALHSRNVILLSVAASGLSWLTLSLADRITLICLAYAFGGVSSGLFEPIGNSLVAKLSSSKNRSTAIGNFAAFGDMGKIALMAGSTALAGLFGVDHACALLGATAAVAFILAFSMIARAAGNDDSAASESPVHLGDLLKNRRFCSATAAGFADSFSSASLYFWIPFLLNAKGIALANTLYFDVIFFVGYMCGRLALGRIADRYGAPDTLIWSKIGMAVLILLLTLTGGRTMIFLLLFLLGIFTRGSSPVIRAMVADSMDEHISFHDAFSTYSFASRGSGAVSRPIFGVLATWTGIASVFYAASAVSLLTIYPAVLYKRQQQSADVSRSHPDLTGETEVEP
jgi:predicted MFS family arabinose efflux permease